MNREIFLEKLEDTPVIMALKDNRNVDYVRESEGEIVFLLTTNIFEVKDIVSTLKKQNKIVFIHFDLVDGISKNQMGLEYIIKEVEPHGIISTKGNIIVQAKKMKLLTIQRHFIVDSISLKNTIEAIKDHKPDAVEIMPGLVNKVVKTIAESVDVPIIVGGLIETKEEVVGCLKAGAVAVSTTREKLWEL